MANTTAEEVAMGLRNILSYADNTGSVNFYMAHGGTNWGPWAGANALDEVPLGNRRGELRGWLKGGGIVGAPYTTCSSSVSSSYSTAEAQDQGLGHKAGATGGWYGREQQLGIEGPLRQQQQEEQQAREGQVHFPIPLSSVYLPHITSYDYASPIGEAGTYGQLGIGGGSKFDALRSVVAAAQVVEVSQLPAAPAPPQLMGYGALQLTEQKALLESIDGISSTCRGSWYFGRHGEGQEGRGVKQQAAAASQGASRLLPSQGSPNRNTGNSGRTAATTTGGGGGGGATSSGVMRRGSRVEASNPPAPPAAVSSTSLYPESQEYYGQHYGLLVYETHLPAPVALGGGQLMLQGIRDTAWVYLGGNIVGYSYREAPKSIYIPPMMQRLQQQQLQYVGEGEAAAADVNGDHAAAAAGGVWSWLTRMLGGHQQREQEQQQPSHRTGRVHRRLKTSPNFLQVREPGGEGIAGEGKAEGF